MNKKVMILTALVFIFSMMLSVCGVSGETDPSVKQVAAGILINNDDVVADVIIDISKGYSVAFDWNGISLIEGEYTNLSFPLVTIVVLGDGVYERVLDEYQNSESFKEADGIMTFVDSIGELNYLFMLGENVPISISFDKNVDEARAAEIMAGIEVTLRSNAGSGN